MQKRASYNVYTETDTNAGFANSDLVRIIQLIEKNESCHFSFVEIVFVTEERILDLNQTYLNHDYKTDIITFPYEDNKEGLEGTLFICVSQLIKQAEAYLVSIENEISRIVIHGLLHLVGYDDKKSNDQKKMTLRENYYLKILFHEEN